MPQYVLSHADLVEMQVVCANVVKTLRASDSALIVFMARRTPAYACAALYYGEVNSLYPPYERRTWLLQEEAKRQRFCVVLADVDPVSTCVQIASLMPGSSCVSRGEEMVEVRFGPASVLALVRALGISIRKFE